MTEEIYLDKIKLGALIVEKELRLIEQFNNLFMDILTRPDIKDIINEYPPFYSCWRSLSELYDFLEYDYLDKLKKGEGVLIKDIMDNYKNGLGINFDNLKYGVNIIRKIMSLSGFHDLVRKGDSFSGGLDALKTKYKIKNE